MREERAIGPGTKRLETERRPGTTAAGTGPCPGAFPQRSGADLGRESIR